MRSTRRASRRYPTRSAARSRGNRLPKRSFALFLLVVLFAGLAVSFLRPMPGAQASSLVVGQPDGSAPLVWPAGGSAAIGIEGYGPLAAAGSAAQRPTASIAKLITTLALFEKKPFKQGKPGATITLTQKDVALFEHYYAIGGAVVKVEAGEKITQYQALQAMLLPSANNMADSMAIWAFGSIDHYVTYANTMVKRLGLSGTVVADDASGMSPHTLSTARDIVRLGELTMQNPVVAGIVSQKSANIPVQGTISSANARLGLDNIIGIKTGLTDEAGGCFLFAAKETLAAGRQVMLIGVVMGAPSLPQAFKDTTALVHSAANALITETIVKKGDQVATITTPWMASAPVYATDDLTIVTFKGLGYKPGLRLASLKPADAAAGSSVGNLDVRVGTYTASTTLLVNQAIKGPTTLWRLTRFFN